MTVVRNVCLMFCLLAGVLGVMSAIGISDVAVGTIVIFSVASVLFGIIHCVRDYRLNTSAVHFTDRNAGVICVMVSLTLMSLSLMVVGYTNSVPIENVLKCIPIITLLVVGFLYHLDP